jgi:hypothetical protein
LSTGSCDARSNSLTKSLTKDVEVVEPPTFVAFRPAEHGDVDPGVFADAALAGPPGPVFEGFAVNLSPVLALGVAELLVGAQSVESGARLDLVGVVAAKCRQALAFEFDGGVLMTLSGSDAPPESGIPVDLRHS